MNIVLTIPNGDLKAAAATATARANLQQFLSLYRLQLPIETPTSSLTHRVLHHVTDATDHAALLRDVRTMVVPHVELLLADRSNRCDFYKLVDALLDAIQVEFGRAFRASVAAAAQAATNVAPSISAPRGLVGNSLSRNQALEIAARHEALLPRVFAALVVVLQVEQRMQKLKMERKRSAAKEKKISSSLQDIRFARLEDEHFTETKLLDLFQLCTDVHALLLAVSSDGSRSAVAPSHAQRYPYVLMLLWNALGASLVHAAEKAPAQFGRQPHTSYTMMMYLFDEKTSAVAQQSLRMYQSLMAFAIDATHATFVAARANPESSNVEQVQSIAKCLMYRVFAEFPRPGSTGDSRQQTVDAEQHFRECVLPVVAQVAAFWNKFRDEQRDASIATWNVFRQALASLTPIAQTTSSSSLGLTTTSAPGPQWKFFQAFVYTTLMQELPSSFDLSFDGSAVKELAASCHVSASASSAVSSFPPNDTEERKVLLMGSLLMSCLAASVSPLPLVRQADTLGVLLDACWTHLAHQPDRIQASSLRDDDTTQPAYFVPPVLIKATPSVLPTSSSSSSSSSLSTSSSLAPVRRLCWEQLWVTSATAADSPSVRRLALQWVRDRLQYLMATASVPQQVLSARLVVLELFVPYLGRCTTALEDRKGREGGNGQQREDEVALLVMNLSLCCGILGELQGNETKLPVSNAATIEVLQKAVRFKLLPQMGKATLERYVDDVIRCCNAFAKDGAAAASVVTATPPPSQRRFEQVSRFWWGYLRSAVSPLRRPQTWQLFGDFGFASRLHSWLEFAQGIVIQVASGAAKHPANVLVLQLLIAPILAKLPLSVLLVPIVVTMFAPSATAAAVTAVTKSTSAEAVAGSVVKYGPPTLSALKLLASVAGQVGESLESMDDAVSAAIFHTTEPQLQQARRDEDAVATPTINNKNGALDDETSEAVRAKLMEPFQGMEDSRRRAFLSSLKALSPLSSVLLFAHRMHESAAHRIQARRNAWKGMQAAQGTGAGAPLMQERDRLYASALLSMLPLSNPRVVSRVRACVENIVLELLDQRKAEQLHLLQFIGEVIARTQNETVKEPLARWLIEMRQRVEASGDRPLLAKL